MYCGFLCEIAADDDSYDETVNCEDTGEDGWHQIWVEWLVLEHYNKDEEGKRTSNHQIWSHDADG